MASGDVWRNTPAAVVAALRAASQSAQVLTGNSPGNAVDVAGFSAWNEPFA